MVAARKAVKYSFLNSGLDSVHMKIDKRRLKEAVYGKVLCHKKRYSCSEFSDTEEKANGAAEARHLSVYIEKFLGLVRHECRSARQDRSFCG